MTVTIRGITSSGSGFNLVDIERVEVAGVTVYTAPPPAPTIPFKVGDFVRVKRSVNRCGTEDGPKARTAGKVTAVTENFSCTVEFPGFIKGWGEGKHSRVYYLCNQRENGAGYQSGKHEAISNIRLIRS